MKTLFAIAFITFFSQSDSNRVVTVKNDIFEITYSEKLQQPLKVIYKVSCTEKNFTRAGLDFYTCDSICTSDSHDYENNIYDKGHMAPAGDFTCDHAKLKETFTYLNCALQHKALNRGPWKSLEDHERGLSQHNEVVVIIDVKFSSRSIKLPTGATVPDGFTKTLKWGHSIESYYFPNTPPFKKSYEEYLAKNVLKDK